MTVTNVPSRCCSQASRTVGACWTPAVTVEQQHTGPVGEGEAAASGELVVEAAAEVAGVAVGEEADVAERLHAAKEVTQANTQSQRCMPQRIEKKRRRGDVLSPLPLRRLSQKSREPRRQPRGLRCGLNSHEVRLACRGLVRPDNRRLFGLPSPLVSSVLTNRTSGCSRLTRGFNRLGPMKPVLSSRYLPPQSFATLWPCAVRDPAPKRDILSERTAFQGSTPFSVIHSGSPLSPDLPRSGTSAPTGILTRSAPFGSRRVVALFHATHAHGVSSVAPPPSSVPLRTPERERVHGFPSRALRRSAMDAFDGILLPWTWRRTAVLRSLTHGAPGNLPALLGFFAGFGLLFLWGEPFSYDRLGYPSVRTCRLRQPCTDSATASPNRLGRPEVQDPNSDPFDVTASS